MRLPKWGRELIGLEILALICGPVSIGLCKVQDPELLPGVIRVWIGIVIGIPVLCFLLCRRREA